MLASDSFTPQVPQAARAWAVPKPGARAPPCFHMSSRGSGAGGIGCYFPEGLATSGASGTPTGTCYRMWASQAGAYLATPQTQSQTDFNFPTRNIHFFLSRSTGTSEKLAKPALRDECPAGGDLAVDLAAFTSH